MKTKVNIGIDIDGVFMDLEYKVIDDKYINIKSVLRDKFKVSSRLYLKLRNSYHIYFNRCTDYGE